MKPIIKLLSAVVSIVVGALVSKAVERTWYAVTGDEAPKKKNKDAREEQSVPRVVSFAAISAATAALINVLVQRAQTKAINRVERHSDEV